jgi:hypothetical protein
MMSDHQYSDQGASLHQAILAPHIVATPTLHGLGACLPSERKQGSSSKYNLFTTHTLMPQMLH